MAPMSTPKKQAAAALPAALVNGRVDSVTSRTDADALQGHFVLIDYSDAAVAEAVKEQMAPKGSPLAEQGFEPGIGSADYGVYNHPGEVGEDGYPVTAVVTLRDEHACMVVVPYAALRPSQAGRR